MLRHPFLGVMQNKRTLVIEKLGNFLLGVEKWIVFELDMYSLETQSSSRNYCFVSVCAL